jgi:hypothetical protein
MTRWLVAVGAVGLAAVAPAADPPVRLAAQLGAPAYADREAATKALEALGPAAIPALETAVRSPDPEVTRRAIPLLARARFKADSAAILATRPVRLDYRRVTLMTAVADLSARTGLDIRLDHARVADLFRPVTCTTNELPPWEAVAAFTRAAGLKECVAPELEIPPAPQLRNRSYYAPPPPTTPADMPIVLTDGPCPAPPGACASAVRVVALPPSFSGARVAGQRTLYLDVTPLPRLKWEGVTAVRLGRATDDTGRSVSAVPTSSVSVGVAPAGTVTPDRPLLRNDVLTVRPNPRVVAVPLRPGSPNARMLTVLEGEVLGEVLAADRELATLQEVEVGSTATGPGGQLIVIEAAPHAGGARVVVRVECPSPWPRLRRRQPDGPLWPDVAAPVGAGYFIRAFDGAGRPLPGTNHPTPRVTDDGVVKTLTWDLHYATLPARLTATGPRVLTIAVPFRLANVPLP